MDGFCSSYLLLPTFNCSPLSSIMIKVHAGPNQSSPNECCETFVLLLLSESVGEDGLVLVKQVRCKVQEH